jgi:hypothetical protein
MAARSLWGNLPSSLFPRLLLGLSVKKNLDGERLANQLLNSGLRVPLKAFGLTRRVINPAAAD